MCSVSWNLLWSGVSVVSILVPITAKQIYIKGIFKEKTKCVWSYEHCIFFLSKQEVWGGSWCYQLLHLCNLLAQEAWNPLSDITCPLTMYLPPFVLLMYETQFHLGNSLLIFIAKHKEIDKEAFELWKKIHQKFSIVWVHANCFNMDSEFLSY